MSLKGFHILFITLSILLAGACSASGFFNYREQPSIVHLLWGILSLLVVMGLFWYGVWFLKKTRKLIL
jgi:hypothetical protein